MTDINPVKVEQIDKPLTIRERLTIALLILIIKVIKPFSWGHEFDKAFKDVEELLNKS
jgi:hypothetical protein